MNFKKICSLILAVVAAGLTSCSSDLNNEEKAPVSPNETAKRALSYCYWGCKNSFRS